MFIIILFYIYFVFNGYMFNLFYIVSNLPTCSFSLTFMYCYLPGRYLKQYKLYIMYGSNEMYVIISQSSQTSFSAITIPRSSTPLSPCSVVSFFFFFFFSLTSTIGPPVFLYTQATIKQQKIQIPNTIKPII